jgi:transcriptional regulator with XRE-family HTH domain
MADFKTTRSIGTRIAAIRKARGFKAAKDLADAIPNDTVTESILQNIEAGRQPDLKVSQLLNIAWALRISPTFLLVPLGTPDGYLDLPNLSDELAALSISEFDAWVAGLTDGSYKARLTDERSERFELESLRELLRERRELHRLEVVRELESDALPGESASAHVRESTLGRIAFSAARIVELEAYLESGGWEVTS